MPKKRRRLRIPHEHRASAWAWYKGYEHGLDAVKYNLSESDTIDSLIEAAFAADDNARQFIGHTDDLETEAEWEAYEDGLSTGISDAAEEIGYIGVLNPPKGTSRRRA